MLLLLSNLISRRSHQINRRETHIIIEECLGVGLWVGPDGGCTRGIYRNALALRNSQPTAVELVARSPLSLLSRHLTQEPSWSSSSQQGESSLKFIETICKGDRIERWWIIVGNTVLGFSPKVHQSHMVATHSPQILLDIHTQQWLWPIICIWGWSEYCSKLWKWGWKKTKLSTTATTTINNMCVQLVVVGDC